MKSIKFKTGTNKQDSKITYTSTQLNKKLLTSSYLARVENEVILNNIILS